MFFEYKKRKKENDYKGSMPPFFIFLTNQSIFKPIFHMQIPKKHTSNLNQPICTFLVTKNQIETKTLFKFD